MPGTTARDAARDDLSALGDIGLQPAHVLVIDQIDLLRAELADLAPAEPPALDGLLWRGNRVSSSGTGSGPRPAKTERRHRCRCHFLRRRPGRRAARRAPPWCAT